MRNAQETLALGIAAALLPIWALLTIGYFAGQRAVHEDCTCICGSGS